MRLRILLAICGALFLASANLEAAELTARAALPQVLESARTWAGDARIVSLSALQVKPDGKAPEWKYSVYSPKGNKRAVVTARGAEVSLREVRLGESTQALGEFIDSDRAMQTAQKNGLRGSEPTMAVKALGSGAQAGIFWVVAGGSNKGDTSVMLIANTGEFFSRSESP